MDPHTHSKEVWDSCAETGITPGGAPMVVKFYPPGTILEVIAYAEAVDDATIAGGFYIGVPPINRGGKWAGRIYRMTIELPAGAMVYCWSVLADEPDVCHVLHVACY
jgi:hypothetical protein